MSMPGPNPYASPQVVDRLPPPEASAASFRRRVRLAVGFLAPLAVANWVQVLLFTVLFNPSYLARILTLLAGLWLIPSLMFAWLRGDMILRWAGTQLHRLFGGDVPLQRWLAVGYAALWMLPWASAVGAVLWAAFLIVVGSGGMSLGAMYIFGAIGNSLGAWCYLTLFWRWWQLRAADATLRNGQDWRASEE